MAEAGIAILIASIATLAIVTVIQFVDRGYRYKKYAHGKISSAYDSPSQ